MRRRTRNTTLAGLAVAATIAAPAAAQSDGPRVSARDAAFLMAAAEGDRFEAVSGRLARKRADDADVKRQGLTMVRHHTMHLRQTERLAAELGVELPDEPSPTQQWEVNALEPLRGGAFDRAYTRLEIADHIEDIEEYTTQSRDADSPVVRAFARRYLPTLRQHQRGFYRAL